MKNENKPIMPDNSFEKKDRQEYDEYYLTPLIVDSILFLPGVWPTLGLMGLAVYGTSQRHLIDSSCEKE